MKPAYARFIETPIMVFGQPFTISKKKPKKARHIAIRQLGLSTGMVVRVRRDKMFV